MARTHNGDFAYDNTGDALVEFFSKAGSLMTGKKRKAYYGDETTALELFKSAWVTDNKTSMKLALWLRDCRGGGAGNRSGFRDCIKWIGERYPEWVKANLHLIPEVGRWDDLKALVGTPCEADAIDFWVRALSENNHLAAKWSPREKNDKELYQKLRKRTGLAPKDFRKKIAGLSKGIVENFMCQKDWQDIEYSKVSSVAMARYNNAFTKHDGARFGQWKDALVDPESGEKVNASVLFPHDVLRTLYSELSVSEGGYYGWTNFNRSGSAQYKDSKLANAQFDALPNYMEGTEQRVMAICDFSGSMSSPVSGQIQAIDVSMSLGLYCSDRVGKGNPFYRTFIPFSDTRKIVNWSKETFSVAAQKYDDGFCGSTNLKGALDQILGAAKLFSATNDQIPNTLLILSDMQFDSMCNNASETSVESAMKEWESAGYTRPKIVYWNLMGYRNAPEKAIRKDVAMVSGFSPSLLKAVFGGDDFTPMGVLLRAVEKYEIVVPESV